MVLKAPPSVKQPPKKKPPPPPVQPMPPNNYGLMQQMIPSYASLMYQRPMTTNAMAPLPPLDPHLLIPKVSDCFNLNGNWFRDTSTEQRKHRKGGVTPNVLAQVKEQIRLREQMLREGQMRQQVMNPDGQFVRGQRKPEAQMPEAMKRESRVRQSEDEDVTMGKRPNSTSDQSQSASKRAKSEEPSASSD